MAISNIVQPKPLTFGVQPSPFVPKSTPVQSAPVSSLNLSGISLSNPKLSVGGTTTPTGTTPDKPYSTGNLSLSPYQQSFAPENVTQQYPAPTLANTGGSTGGSSYKGISITPGSDAQVQAQVQKIDNPQTSSQTGSSPVIPGLVNPNFSGTTGGSQGTPQASPYNQAGQGLLNIGQNGSQGYNDAVNNLASFNRKLAQTYGNIENTPIPLEFQQGREQVLARQAVSEQAALQGAVNQQQTQQGQQISAFGTAGTLTAPQNIFGTLTDPTTGKPVNPQQAGQIQSTVANLAQNVASGKISYQDALSQLGSYGPNVQNALLQTIQQSNPNFNVNQNIGQSSSQQNIVGTQSQQIAGYQSALQQGKNLQSQLSDLISTFGLNPNDINAANSGLQAIARNTSSSQYKILQNYVNDIANTYAQVLTPPGGSSTDTTRSIATSMLDATASGQSIQAVMQSLDQAAQAKIAGVSTTGNTNSNGNIFSF